MRFHFEILEIEKLRSHEATDPEMLKKFVEEVRSDGALFKPILVDEETLVILDGHHRFEALKLLGCKRIPVYLVDYNDDDISVTTWPNAIVENITKKDIIRMGLSENVYPPKTSRHVIKGKVKDRPIDLEELY